MMFLLLVMILSFPKTVLGQNSEGPPSPSRFCVNLQNPQETQLKLIQTFRDNLDPLKIAYLEARLQSEKTMDLNCGKDQGRQPFASLSEFAQAIPLSFRDTSFYNSKAGIIKRECIAASMRREPGNKGYVCNYPPSAKDGPEEAGKTAEAQNISQGVKESYGTAGGTTLQCVSDDLVDYIYFAVNSAIQCLSPEDPIDSRVIFKKFNNETAFNHSIASAGGVGIGQATTSSVEELTSILGNGQYVLNNVVNSEKNSCKAFKKIAEKDLKEPPPIKEDNYCQWVNAGEGLARSLLYNVGYFVALRDYYIKPALKSGNKELINAYTTIAYGHEGIKVAKTLMNKFRIHNKTNAKTVLTKLEKASLYLKETQGKMREMYCLKKGLKPKQKCSDLKLKPEELRGDLCVSN